MHRMPPGRCDLHLLWNATKQKLQVSRGRPHRPGATKSRPGFEFFLSFLNKGSSWLSFPLLAHLLQAQSISPCSQGVSLDGFPSLTLHLAKALADLSQNARRLPEKKFSCATQLPAHLTQLVCAPPPSKRISSSSFETLEMSLPGPPWQPPQKAKQTAWEITLSSP